MGMVTLVCLFLLISGDTRISVKRVLMYTNRGFCSTRAVWLLARFTAKVSRLKRHFTTFYFFLVNARPSLVYN